MAKTLFINSTLVSLPTYQLSVFKGAPISSYKTIEKHWRNFLWKCSNEKKHVLLMRWFVVTYLKDKGGLGINRLANTNFSLLCKWIFIFYDEQKPSWKRLILAKYNHHSYIGEIPTIGKYKRIGLVPSQVNWKINDGESLSSVKGASNEKSPISLYRPWLFALSNIQN